MDSNAIVSGRRTGETQQDFNLSDLAAQEVESRVVDSLVARDDRGVRAGDKRSSRCVHSRRYVGDKALVVAVAEQDRDVGIACSRVDERQELV